MSLESEHIGTGDNFYNYLVISKIHAIMVIYKTKGVKTMKYVLESNNLACREYGETVGNILNKMYAIEDSLEFLVKNYKEEFLTEELIKSFPQTKNVFPAYAYDQILVDLDSANDEFYIGRTGGNAQEDIYLEVVTKEIAENNDRDMGATGEGYNLADGVNSYYTRLADTEYYFRFM
jgi:hypothetical protein